jgi:hypothetical protein
LVYGGEGDEYLGGGGFMVRRGIAPGADAWERGLVEKWEIGERDGHTTVRDSSVVVDN